MAILKSSTRTRAASSRVSPSPTSWSSTRLRSAWTAGARGAINVFLERFWRSVKYEEVYLRAYDSVDEARASLSRYMSLDARTPDQAYFNSLPFRAAA